MYMSENHQKKLASPKANQCKRKITYLNDKEFSSSCQENAITPEANGENKRINICQN